MFDLNPALPVCLSTETLLQRDSQNPPRKMSSVVPIARQLSHSVEKWLFIFSYSRPPSINRNISMPYVPANNLLLALTAMALTSAAINPCFLSLHVLPLSVDQQTLPPRYVPAKRGKISNRTDQANGNSAFTEIQFDPLSVGRKRPLP
jgi:hypothetical protein